MITDQEKTVFAGDSITVPCPYLPEYTLNVKYWCQGYFHDFCTSLARTDENTGSSSAGRVTIADDPTQQVFTVTMHEMKENESGWYWCGVEIGHIWTKDISTSVYISVKQGISVETNELSAEEGDSVTVQFHYSEKHREDEKKWCRSGNVKSCTVTNNGTYSSKSLLISDNRKDTVTVTMRQLEFRDAGWYYCGAGEHQASVHVLVTSRSTTNDSSQAMRTFGVKPGESATIPCSYDSSYMEYNKYWCHGNFFDFCKIQAYANERREKVSVTDHPAESFFTVTMDNLQTKDSGVYWCAVKKSGPDFKEEIYIKVKSDPDLSVMESRVRGEEGGSVTVRCLCSATYRTATKQWCRFRDRKCNTVKKTEKFLNLAVQLRSDGLEFSVQLIGLKKNDAGWYWCSSGELQVPVYISVSDPHPDVDSMRTLKNVAVKHGGSVTIPCTYEKQYKASRKFWCRGYYWSSCRIVAFANSNGSTSVIDHPAQNLFTVELNPVSQSGIHWCAAKIYNQMYDRDYVDLTVSQDPDLSVMESTVRGEEGGSITVQCLYSAAYQDKQKQWCRFRDEQCTTVGSTTPSQNSAIQFSGDGKRSFTVQMSGLKKSDAGWYWCSAGNLQVPVHISVSGNSPGLPENQIEENKYQRELLLWVLAALLVLFCFLDVWYYLRLVAVLLRAWFLAPVFDITAEQSVGGHVLLHDVDMCHMNNAHYLRECDFARISLYARNGVLRAARTLGATMVVGATTVRYRRPLCVGEKFELRSRIVTWDDKAFYLEQRFVSCRDEMVSAVMFCKQNVLRSSPDKILQHLCKRKVEVPEFPEELQHWISFITASSQALKAESGAEKKSE
ncbi:Protein THEM6 [Bagarius yarrelli]|uniref:Protein THEM6 n=1 Tax=Bagarius yarrelli TaxID=175774 RepID=A0A556UG46_BAGYA|nr:Protein THEM6 [Bagarius yarrelli]